MRDIPLHEFMNGRTQEVVAGLIGVTQSAVHQMLNSGRDIRVRKIGKSWSAYEVKPVGRPIPVNSGAAG